MNKVSIIVIPLLAAGLVYVLVGLKLQTVATQPKKSQNLSHIKTGKVFIYDFFLGEVKDAKAFNLLIVCNLHKYKLLAFISGIAFLLLYLYKSKNRKNKAYNIDFLLRK